VQGEKKERWMELAEKAAVEQDPAKLLELITELNKLLLEKEQRLGMKTTLTIRCPTCGAAPGKKCELTDGQPRADSHRDRRLIAKDPKS